MTTACASSPQVMRDRLLQALDAQSDICNPVLVVEIFSLLEKYPITREVLEETRLGKLVNDVRKKTKNTDVARRAKKLLLTWQKFIEPGGSNSTADQASIPAPPLTPPTSKVGSELKDRSDFNNCSSANGKNPHSNRTQTPPAKKSRKSLKSDAKDSSAGRGNLLSDWNNGSEPDRLGRLPANALKPHPSARELPPQTALEEVVSRKHCRPRSPQQQPPLQSTLADPDSHYADKPNLGLSFQSIQRSDGKLSDSNYDNKLTSLSAVYTRVKKSKRKNKDPCSDLSSDGKPDTKTLGFKERGLTFNPVTGQINPLFGTSSLTKEELREDPVPHPETAERPTHPAYDPLKQTVYKELSHNAIVQSYLRQQSSLLSSSGNRAVGSSATETGGDRPSATPIERHELAPEPPVTDLLPGVGREVRSRDMDRLHTLEWSGVNGCYDNKGSWFDWTKCITLDPHGDEGRLNVLPYVCLD